MDAWYDLSAWLSAKSSGSLAKASLAILRSTVPSVLISAGARPGAGPPTWAIFAIRSRLPSMVALTGHRAQAGGGAKAGGHGDDRGGERGGRATGASAKGVGSALLLSFRRATSVCSRP